MERSTAASPGTPNKMNSSSRTAFILDYLHGYQETLWHEAEREAITQGRSLFTFVGQSLLRGDKSDTKASNTVYELARSPLIGSYLLSGATLGSYISKEEYARSLKSFMDKPGASIGPVPASIPTITIENRSGISRMVEHMVEAHGRKRIAFIAGPIGSSESEERLAAYREALAARGIRIDDKLLYNGNFWYNGGAAAIKEFLDVRKTDFDAVMAANDYMAIGAMRELIARGIKVPEAVSVSGYDDTLEGLTETPSITSVRQPFPEQTAAAVRYIAELASGKDAPVPAPLATGMVLRRSCGCETMSQELAGRGRISKTPERMPEPQEIMADLMQVMPVDPKNRATMLALSTTAVRCAGRGDFREFFEAAEKAIYECLACHGSFEKWQDYFSVVRSDLLPAISGCDAAIEFENVLGRLRILVSSLSFGTATVKRSKILTFEEDISDAFKAVGGSDSFEALGESLATELERLGVRTFYLALRADAGDSREGDGWTVNGDFMLYAARRDGENAMASLGGGAYPAIQLLPEEALPKRTFALVVMPVTFGSTFFGIAAFERGPDEGSVYKLISDQIGANVQNIALFKKTKLAEAAITARSAAVEGLAKPMGSSVMEVSRIVEARAVTVKSVGEAAARTREDIVATQDMIQRITAGMKQMGEFVEVIDDIASTVNLLGLNAAIEAARAGSNGKGFGVIASEIRKLAESTKTNSDRIRSLIKNVVSDVDSTAEAAGRSQSTFLRLDADVAEVLESLKQIASRMESLSSMSVDLLHAMK